MTLTLKTLLYKTAANLILASAASFMLSMPYAVASDSSVIDDFSNSALASTGFDRQFLNDSLSGGKTSTKQLIEHGTLHVTGELVPPRGQPGWASSVIPLSTEGEVFDASAYEGIQLRVKVTQGNLSISANSTEVTNFDYHAAALVVTADGQFHDVAIPFSSMKRMWSEQTALNPKTLNSLSIVAYSMQKASFDFEVDDVRFY